MNGVAEEPRLAGVICETVQIEEDHPYEAIIETAKQRGCDLIVMASHGRSGIAAIVLGSVTTKVLTHTKFQFLSATDAIGPGLKSGSRARATLCSVPARQASAIVASRANAGHLRLRI